MEGGRGGRGYEIVIVTGDWLGMERGGMGTGKTKTDRQTGRQTDKEHGE